MSNDACERELIAAGIRNLDAADAIKRMNELDDAMNRALNAASEGVELESGIPTPLRSKVAEVAKRESAKYYKILKQGRVASMMTNPSTHAVNVSATGGQVAMNVIEESLSVAMSRMTKGEKREWSELTHYVGGMQRAAVDGLSVMGHILKSARKQGAVSSPEIEALLKKKGYSPELARGKSDILMFQDVGDPYAIKDFSEKITSNGLKYLMNGILHLPFTALQTPDTFFKMISHRAKVQMLASREGVRTHGLIPGSESLDRFVANNWEEMSAKVKAGAKMEELGDSAAAGYKYAQEATFTEKPQTGFGRFLTNPVKRDGPMTTAIAETVELISPFRNIYVNLMRQTLSRRLLPFVDAATRAEFNSADKIVRQTARARTAASWAVVAGTFTTFNALRGDEDTDFPVKVHSPGALNPAVQQLQFEMYGKVGTTIQFGKDTYIPMSMLPPGISIPLLLVTAGAESMKEMRYRNPANPEEAEMEQYLRFAGPFINAVADGAWTSQYSEFINKMGWALQSGDPSAIGKTLADMAAGPVQAPRWIQELMENYTGSVKDYDGFWDKFRDKTVGNAESYAEKIGMGGEAIPRLTKFGVNTSNDMFAGLSSDTMDFLKVIEYDKHYPANTSKSISGMGNSKNRVPSTVDSHDMNKEEREKFDRLTAKARIQGKTLDDDIRALFSRNNVYDPDSLKADGSPGTGFTKIQLVKAVSDIQAKHRKFAKELIKYDPKFNISVRQAENFRKFQVDNAYVDEATADKIYRNRMEETNAMRRHLRSYYQ